MGYFITKELCILVESYWARMALDDIPVYFSAGLVERANEYYKLYINWTSEKIKNTFCERNAFDFAHIKSFESSFASDPGPMFIGFNSGSCLQLQACFMQALRLRSLRNGAMMLRIWLFYLVTALLELVCFT